MLFDAPLDDRLPAGDDIPPAFAGDNASSTAEHMTTPREHFGLESEALFQLVVDLAPDPTIVADHDGQISFVNQQAASLFGYTRKYLLGRPVEFLIPERFRVAHRYHRAEYAAAPYPRPMGANLRLFGRRRDGSEFPILVSLTPLPAFGQHAGGHVEHGARGGRGLGVVLASIRDITERVRLETTQAATEAALAQATVCEAQAAERAERLQAILDAMTDGVSVYDRDGHIALTNRAYRELLAIDRMPGFDTLPAFERAQLLEVRDIAGRPLAPDQYPIARALQGETVTGASADCFLKTLDGHELYTNSSAIPLRDRTGAIAGAVVVMRDITWRRQFRLEREVARAHELAVREVNRALEEFLITAAHDLRNPLGAVLGFIELAVRQVQRLATEVHTTNATSSTTTATNAEANAEIACRVESVQARLEDAHQSGLRMARLMNVLFDTAALRAGGKPLQLHRAPCDLAALVRDQVAELRGSAPERTVQLHIVDDEPIMVDADSDRIGQVITNYLTNALKYAPAERPIEVSLESYRAGDATQVRVAVRDEGPGLPEEEQARVWEMFHRAPSVAVQSGAIESLGLGLHICKTIIEAHGGHVGVESEVGHGSTFWFTLPRSAHSSPPDGVVL